jgi:integrase/recombinase XerD
MGRKVWVPAVSGRLTPYAVGYVSWLRAQCYSRSAISDRLWQFDQLSRWLDDEGRAVGQVSAADCGRFAASRRAAGRMTLVAPQSMALPIVSLRTIGVTPASVPPLARGLVEELLADYGSYLLIERGLSPHTVFDAYVPAARLLLTGRDGRRGRGGVWLDRLTAADVSVFLARECSDRSVSGTRDLVCALRSFLRYLHLTGRIEAPLLGAAGGRGSAGSHTAAGPGPGGGEAAVGQL